MTFLLRSEHRPAFGTGRAPRGAATTELMLGMLFLLPMLLYAVYLQDALTVSLRTQQVAIHALWDSPAFPSHRYSNPANDSLTNATTQINTLVNAAQRSRDHVESLYQYLNPFDAAAGLKTVMIEKPHLDMASQPKVDTPGVPGGMDPSLADPNFVGARARVMGVTPREMMDFQPRFAVPDSNADPDKDFISTGLLRRDFIVKMQASAMAYNLPIASKTLFSSFSPVELFTRPFLRFCAVGKAQENSQCNLTNGFALLVDDFSIYPSGATTRNQESDNPELWGVVDRMYEDLAMKFDTVHKDQDTFFRANDVLGPGHTLLPPKFVLWELGAGPGAGHTHSVSTGSGTDRPVYTVPYDDPQSEAAYRARSDRYLGLP